MSFIIASPATPADVVYVLPVAQGSVGRMHCLGPALV